MTKFGKALIQSAKEAREIARAFKEDISTTPKRKIRLKSKPLKRTKKRT